ncbi:hypothetical protein PTD2_03991 [Pseudoalteromonas tunicata D2]|uniref:Uncharacterized protein n=1 Tax=Pseudoalteromonas tunicata D2 TaxID=87626 RepID=A4C569_9GAMM|nr:hypothetical protein PTD2_03991 [Pseudoalteromonas tunicata D2]
MRNIYVLLGIYLKKEFKNSQKYINQN